MAKWKTKAKASLKRIQYIIAAVVVVICLTLWVLDYTGIVEYSELFGGVGLSGDNGYSGNAEVAVHFVDVGQGDCQLIVAGDSVVLIDGGEYEQSGKVRWYLHSLGITEIDYVISTHPHSDHCGSLSDVIREFKVLNVIAPRVPDELVPTGGSYPYFLEAVADEGCGLTPANVGDVYTLDKGATLEILAPINYNVDELNNLSVVCMLRYGEDSVLFTGDAEYDEEHDIIYAGYDIDADVLKVGHHGSSTSSSYDFLNEVTPEYCVIGVGADNDYGHPHQKVMGRLSDFTDEIYRTDLQGDIVCELDGKGGYVFVYDGGK